MIDKILDEILYGNEIEDTSRRLPSNRWRFSLLIFVFDFLLIAIVLMAFRTREIVRHIEFLEKVNKEYLSILATRKVAQVVVLYITATPTPTPTESPGSGREGTAIAYAKPTYVTASPTGKITPPSPTSPALSPTPSALPSNTPTLLPPPTNTSIPSPPPFTDTPFPPPPSITSTSPPPPPTGTSTLPPPPPTSTPTSPPSPTDTPVPPTDTFTPVPPTDTPLPPPTDTPTYTPIPTDTPTDTPPPPTDTPTNTPTPVPYPGRVIFPSQTDCGDNPPYYSDPHYIEGPPDGQCVLLGCSTSDIITLDMGEETGIIDGPGDDFCYYEYWNPSVIGIVFDPVQIEVSEDNSSWQTVLVNRNSYNIPAASLRAGYDADGDGNYPGDPDDGSGVTINIGNDDGTVYRYLHLFVPNPPGTFSGGVEMDAIERLH